MIKITIPKSDDTRGMNMPAFLSKGRTVFITHEEREKMWKYLIAAERKAKKAKKLKG